MKKIVWILPTLWVLACRPSTPIQTGEERDAQTRLWDREQPLSVVARACTLQSTLSATNPQPVGMSESEGTPNLSNPKMTVSLWGPSDQLTLSINKNDVWDRRKGWEKTVTLDELKAGYFAPINAKNPDPLGFSTACYPTPEGTWVDPYAAWRVYPFPCIKPVGQVTVLAGDFADMPSPAATTRLHNGLTEVALRQGQAQGTLRYLVMMEENVIAVQGTFQNLQKELKLRLARHRDTYDPDDLPALRGRRYRNYDVRADSAWNQRLEAPESGTDGTFFWIKQKMPAEKTYPQGFEYLLVGLIDGAEYTVETIEDGTDIRTLPRSDGQLANYVKERAARGAAAVATFKKQKDQDFTAYTTVVTTNDAKDLLAEAKRRLRAAQKQGMPGLIQTNEAWYTALYNKREQGRLFTGQVEDVKRAMPGLFYSWIYDHSLTSPDPTRHEAQAKGYSVLEEDAPNWHSLPCYNELFMSTPLSVANRSELLSYYVKLIGHWHEVARKNAREVFGLPGLYVGHGYLPPIKPDEYPHSHVVYELSMDMPAQLIKYLWDVWEYEGDTRLLREQVYPVLKDLAVFYAAFVKLEADGYYHIEPTIPQERWVFNYRFKYNRDATTSIALFRWAFRRAAEAAALLDVDEAERTHWLELSEKLPPYPQTTTPDGPIWIPVAGDPLQEDLSIGCLAKISGMMAPVTLTNEVNLDSDPADLAIALRSARFHDPVVWDKYFVFHLLGQAKDRLYRYVGTTGRWQNQSMLASMKKSEEGYHILDTPEAQVNACWLEPERLLNSRSGRMHLFPCVADDLTISFRQLLASGGFEVSAERQKGDVTFLEIKARQSTPCRVANPWPGQKVMVVNTKTGEQISPSYDTHRLPGFSFAARAGATYSIRRADEAAK